MQSPKKIKATYNEIARITQYVREIRARLQEIVTGTASATLSSGAGSKSFTNWDPTKLRAEEAKSLREIETLRNRIAGRAAKSIGVAMIGRC